MSRKVSAISSCFYSFQKPLEAIKTSHLSENLQKTAFSGFYPSPTLLSASYIIQTRIVFNFQNSFEDNTPLIAFFVLFCKFGISMSMCACYVSTPYVFPVMQAGLAFGICNIGGRLFSIASPYVAEIKIPTPMICFSIMSIIGLILCLFVSTSED